MVGLVTSGSCNIEDVDSSRIVCGPSGEMLAPAVVLPGMGFSEDRERLSIGVVRSVIGESGRRSSGGRSPALMGVESKLSGGS